MNNTEKFTWTRNATIAGVILLLVTGLIAYSYYESTQVDDRRIASLEQSANEASKDAEVAQINVLKAELNLFYTLHGRYPITLDELEEEIIESNDQERIDNNKKLQTEVDELKYSSRGDNEAYKITYKDLDGKLITAEGNYREDYR